MAGPPGPGGQGRHADVQLPSCSEALDKGAELFKWDERKAQSGKRTGIEGARRRRGREHVLRRIERLRRHAASSSRTAASTCSRASATSAPNR